MSLTLGLGWGVSALHLKRHRWDSRVGERQQETTMVKESLYRNTLKRKPQLNKKKNTKE